MVRRSRLRKVLLSGIGVAAALSLQGCSPGANAIVPAVGPTLAVYAAAPFAVPSVLAALLGLGYRAWFMHGVTETALTLVGRAAEMTDIFESRSCPWLAETPRIRRGKPSLFKVIEWLPSA